MRTRKIDLVKEIEENAKRERNNKALARKPNNYGPVMRLAELLYNGFPTEEALKRIEKEFEININGELKQKWVDKAIKLKSRRSQNFAKRGEKFSQR